MRWIFCAAAAIVGYQVLCPPVVGLADQGDFRRVIGKFGYGPEQPATYYDYVTLKYVRDPNYRSPDWEQISSEDLFVGTAVLINYVYSTDGKLDIRAIGLVHSISFLVAFAWLVYQTQRFRPKYWIWFAFLLITTDVARVIYFNTFYAEPASYIFCIFLLAESFGICMGEATAARLARWALWATLFVLAKPMNAPLGLLLAAYVIRLGWRDKVAWSGAAAILLASVFSIVTAPAPVKDVNAYDLVFVGVLPESKAPAADLVTLGLDPGLAVLSGTGAWGKNSAFRQLQNRGIIGKKLTVLTIVRFYLERPARVWRRILRELPVAMTLRPPLGNFDRSSGSAPGSMSSAFSLWSYFHERVLARAAPIIFLLLPIPAVVALIRRIYTRERRLAEECFGLLALCCMTLFLAITFTSAWETVKHMFLFNVLLDACLVCTAALAGTAAQKSYGTLSSAILRYREDLQYRRDNKVTEDCTLLR
jgi:hypothetical protein